MGLLALSIMFGLIAWFVCGKVHNSGILFLIGAAVGSFVIAIGISIKERSDQLKDKEALLEIDNTIVILKERAEKSTLEFKVHLASYPDIEKEIFDKINPSTTSVYVLKYPELKSSAVLMYLAKTILSLQTEVYNKRIDKEIILARIRFRPVNPWVLSFFIPKFSQYTKELKK